MGKDVYIRDEFGERKRLYAIREPVGRGRQLVLQVNGSDAKVAQCQMIACSRSIDRHRVDELKSAVPDFASTRGSWTILPSSWTCLEIKAIAEQRRHEDQRPARGWTSRPSQWFYCNAGHERKTFSWFTYSDGGRKWGSRGVEELFATCRASISGFCIKEATACISRPMEAQPHQPPRELQLPNGHGSDVTTHETTSTVERHSNTLCDLPTELLELIVDLAMDGREGLSTLTREDYKDWDEPNFEFGMARPAILCVNRRLNEIANSIRRRRNGKVVISTDHWLSHRISSRRKVLSAASSRQIQFAQTLHILVNELCPSTNNPTVTQLASICRFTTPPFRIVVSFASEILADVWPAAVWTMYVSELVQPLEDMVRTSGVEMIIEGPDLVDVDYDQFDLQQGVLLETAAKIGSLAIVQHLLQKMEVPQPDVSFESTVYHATERGNYEVVRELLVNRQMYGVLSMWNGPSELERWCWRGNAYDGGHKRIEDLLDSLFKPVF